MKYLFLIAFTTNLIAGDLTTFNFAKDVGQGYNTKLKDVENCFKVEAKEIAAAKPIVSYEVLGGKMMATWGEAMVARQTTTIGTVKALKLSLHKNFVGLKKMPYDKIKWLCGDEYVSEIDVGGQIGYTWSASKEAIASKKLESFADGDKVAGNIVKTIEDARKDTSSYGHFQSPDLKLSKGCVRPSEECFTEYKKEAAKLTIKEAHAIRAKTLPLTKEMYEKMQAEI